jgi:dephospho-CoA kinase
MLPTSAAIAILVSICAIRASFINVLRSIDRTTGSDSNVLSITKPNEAEQQHNQQTELSSLSLQQSLFLEIVYGFFVFVPVFFLLSHIIKRLVIRSYKTVQRIARNNENELIRRIDSSAYCGILYLTSSVIFVELWLYATRARTRSNESLPTSSTSFAALFLFRFTHLILVALGIHLGQSLVVIAITGNIATGKSTVVGILASGSSTSTKTNVEKESHYKHEFYIIDSDTIGHEILLPPSVLRSSLRNNGTTALIDHKGYSVSSKDSVYYKIIEEFGESSVNNMNILMSSSEEKTNVFDCMKTAKSNDKDETVLLIDRRKLGSIIFKEPSLRQKLNRITHPKIVSILLKCMIYRSIRFPMSVVCVDVPLLFESRSAWLYGLIVVVACYDSDVQYKRLQQRNSDLTKEQCYDRITSQMPIERKSEMADIVVDNTTLSCDELKEHVWQNVRNDIIGRLYGFHYPVLSMSSCVFWIGMSMLLVELS